MKAPLTKPVTQTPGRTETDRTTQMPPFWVDADSPEEDGQFVAAAG
ncbi:hypothetical protein [Maricaulis sp. D1M11]